MKSFFIFFVRYSSHHYTANGEDSQTNSNFLDAYGIKRIECGVKNETK